MGMVFVVMMFDVLLVLSERGERRIFILRRKNYIFGDTFLFPRVFRPARST